VSKECSGLSNNLVFPELCRENFPGYWWRDVNGIKRCNYREIVCDFTTLEESLAWLKSTQGKGSIRASSKNGLILSATAFTDYETLAITLTRVTVHGEHPSKFPTLDSAISMASD